MITEIEQFHHHQKQIRSRFFFTLTKIAVAQICGSVGFRAAQTSALDALTDIAARYLHGLAKSSASSSHLSGRTDSNALDFIFALEDLCSVRGFPGASNYVADLSLYSSSTIKGIVKFVDYSPELPFAMPLPPCCVEGAERALLKRGNCDGAKHVPEWLPPFPKTALPEEETGIEKKWGSDRSFCGEDGKQRMEVKGKGKKELPAKRAKVRFKMGVGMGVLRVGGTTSNGVCGGRKSELDWRGRR